MRIHVAMAAAAACVLAAVPANSADIAAPVVEPVAVASDWSGFYVGAHAGYGWGEASVSDPALLLGPVFIGLQADLPDYDIDGFLGGLQAGYQVQNGSFVFGVEGDVSFGDIEGDESLIDAGPAFQLGLQTNVEWLATLRARGGVTFDRFLVYATGGLAVGEVESGLYASSNLFGFNEEFNSSETHIGWTVGAGVEAMVTEHLSLKAEYLYVDLGEEEYNVPVIGPLGVQGDVDVDMHVARVGLNYRF